MSQNQDQKQKGFSKRIRDIFDVGGEGTASIIGELLSESVVGTFLPGVTTVYFSYKQKRIERNIEKFMLEVKKKEAEFNQRLSRLETKPLGSIKDKYLGIVMDYVVDEVQEEKIGYIVNGMLNLFSLEDLQEDFVLTYYDTMRNLRLVDIAVLKMYYSLYNIGLQAMDFQAIMNEFGIDYDQYNAVREKLAILGLLATTRDKELDYLYNNVIEMQSYLEALSKGKNKKLDKLRRLSKNDGYLISRFGRNFIDFFIQEANNISQIHEK
ncbi:hypothetical protein [Effusibacillus consociatus]|uniref:Uncharacterized protein n=1 Tax=Effusibacillus consociatus TaxID=1117041 RepID=A0ABV9PXB9_9BACL